MSNFCRTKILASIKSLNEIGLVLKKGVDIIDFKDPSVGSLGALSIKQISFFLKSIPSNQLTSATIGDIKDIKIIKQKVIELSKTSIDFIKIGFFFDEKKIKLLKKAPSWYHPGKSGTFSIGKFDLGYFGEIHPNILKKLS